jgi:hypothetical protein
MGSINKIPRCPLVNRPKLKEGNTLPIFGAGQSAALCG